MLKYGYLYKAKINQITFNILKGEVDVFKSQHITKKTLDPITPKVVDNKRNSN